MFYENDEGLSGKYKTYYRELLVILKNRNYAILKSTKKQ